MGLLEDLRFRQLFGQGSAFGPETPFGINNSAPSGTPLFSAPAVTLPTSPINPPDTKKGKLPTPEIDAYKEYLRSQPNRSEHQLNKLGKALSMVAGVAEGYNRGVAPGINVGMGLIQRPYKEALEDWQGKGGRLKELAGIEVAESARDREIAETARKAELEKTKDARESMLAISRVLTDQSQIAKAEADIATGKYSYAVHDGVLWKTDKASGKAEKVTQVAQTPEQQYQMKFDWWKRQNEIEQRDRKELIGINHVNELIKLDRKHLFDGELITHRWNLENSGETVLNQNRAFTGAVQEVKETMPDLYNEVFVVDPKTGRASLKPDATDEAKARYAKTLITIADRKLGRDVPSLGLPSGTGPIRAPGQESTTETTTSEAPAGQDPALRAAAIKYLQDNDYKENEESIAAAIEEIRNAAPNTTPSVNAPPTATPSVTLPPFQHETGDFSFPMGGGDIGPPALFRQLMGPDFGSINSSAAMNEIQRVQEARRRLEQAYRSRMGTGTIGGR